MQYRPQPPFAGRRPASPFDSLATFPSGCLVTLGALTVVGAVVALAVLAVMVPGYRSSASYREAMARINEDPRATELLGEPIRETALVAFESDWGERGVERKFILEVAGPMGNGRLAAEARETGGGVQITGWTLTLDREGLPRETGRNASGGSALPRKQRPF
ncbi:MAG: cytochrome c oxidase assembly factor Coa1 family protein [Alphaproteobacteria bacterium]